MTLCYGYLWNDRNEALDPLDEALANQGLDDDTLQCAATMGEEMPAQLCAGVCDNLSICLDSADKSARCTDNLVGMRSILSGWFNDNTSDACDRINDDCGLAAAILGGT
ncbi:MAG: hypothetical protein GXP27_19220 [Planctomycetes bacterium]|nr:hypothetical protein [Planctomycetota bacterium]